MVNHLNPRPVVYDFCKHYLALALQTHKDTPTFHYEVELHERQLSPQTLAPANFIRINIQTTPLYSK